MSPFVKKISEERGLPHTLAMIVRASARDAKPKAGALRGGRWNQHSLLFCFSSGKKKKKTQNNLKINKARASIIHFGMFPFTLFKR